jgi:hypothetical protein
VRFLYFSRHGGVYLDGPSIRPSEHQSEKARGFFTEQALHERATPGGYAALIDAYRLRVPLPRTLSANITA